MAIDTTRYEYFAFLRQELDELIEEEQSKKLIEADINLPDVPSHTPERDRASAASKLNAL